MEQALSDVHLEAVAGMNVFDGAADGRQVRLAVKAANHGRQPCNRVRDSWRERCTDGRRHPPSERLSKPAANCLKSPGGALALAQSVRLGQAGGNQPGALL